MIMLLVVMMMMMMMMMMLALAGYDYTWNGDRMWRKTRSPNKKSPCIGTDVSAPGSRGIFLVHLTRLFPYDDWEYFSCSGQTLVCSTSKASFLYPSYPDDVGKSRCCIQSATLMTISCDAPWH
jgi:hypothetical protein